MAGIDFIHQNGVDYEIVPEIAPLFKTTVAYHTGDHVIYEAGWYTFKADKSAGAWDATKVNGPFKVSEQLTNLKEDLSAVSCKTNIEWVLGKSIDASGELFTQASCATSKEIQCQAGDVFVCKNARKDANDKWFIGFLVMYTLANGVLTFVERQAFTESSNPQTVIPSGVNLCYIVFGRQSLSGVTMTAEDIATYSSYEIYRKGIGAKESIFPFGTAVQTSCDTDGCLAVTSVKTGSNVVYTLKDNAPSKTWYTSFACRGINYQITNNETYSTTYQIAFTDNLASASNNAYQNVCLCINLASKTLIWKNNRDLTVDDYVMQVFLNGKNITPWYMSAFAEAGVIESLLDGYPTKPDFLTRNLYKVFKKVGAIGDSWTAGYLSTGSHTYGESDGYAWPDYMETVKNKWVNGGYSGATTKTYLTDEISSNGGGHLAIEAAGQCQAYVIGLGFNDSRPVEGEGVPVGAIGDIGDSSKDTFYYWYSHIIDWAVNLNEDAFVFCQTMYPPLNNGTDDFASRFAPYNVAIRNIVNYYQTTENNNKIRLLDLEQRPDLYAALGRGWDVNTSHHGCVGYEFLAECLKSVLGDELAEHPDLYHNIREIPYTE